MKKKFFALMGNLNEYYFPTTKNIHLLTRKEERALIDGIDCYTRPLRAFEKVFNRRRPVLTIKDKKYLIEIMPIEELENFLENKYAGKEFRRSKINQLRKALSAMKANYQTALPMIGRLIESNLRLVVAIAKGYAHKGVDMDDLVGYGNIGLWRAAEKFDSRQPVRFCTYAGWAIRTHIIQGLCQKTGRAFQFQQRMVSLSDINFTEQLVAKKSEEVPETHQDELRDLVNNILTDERERAIIKMRFGLDDYEKTTLEQVGEKFGITKERVRQIEVRALNKLEVNEKIGKIYKQYVESLD